MVFQKKHFDSIQIAMVASDFTDEFNYANRFEGAAEPAAQTVEKWCPPPFGMVKLNVDAEVINDGHIGCGMVIGGIVKGMSSLLQQS